MLEKILFVDDDTNILQGFKRNFRRRYQVETAEGGTQGLKMIRENGTFAVIISDLKMPEMDGIQFLSKVREAAPNSIRILLTGQAEMKDAIDVVNQGHIFRFLTKPCPADVLIKAINAAIEQYRLIKSEKELLEKTLKGSVKLLVDILSTTHPEVFSHSVQVQRYARKIATRLSFESTWQIDVAAMLSQIGCINVAEEVVKKKFNGQSLTEEESKEFYKHPETGKKLLENIPRLEKIAESIAYQHKRFNGGGPPQKLKKGNDIPIIARILKVALDYSELESTGHTPQQAVETMRQNIQWYDPDVLSALEAVIIKVDDGFVVEEIDPKDIQVGMILADDIKTKYGTMLISKGHEISYVLKLRIFNFAKTNNIQQSIKILRASQN